MDDLDIWRTADAVMKLAGDRAFFLAHTRAIAMFELGDAEGFRVWTRVAKAIEALQTKDAPDGQPIH